MNRQRTLKTDRDLSGVTVLDGKIYVTSGFSTMYVYDSESFKQLKDMVVNLRVNHFFQRLWKKKTSLEAIASCSSNHCLYVIDYNNRCILRLTSDGRDVIKWLDTSIRVT